MISRYAVHPADYVGYDTKKLREQFLAEDLVKNDDAQWIYSHHDRFIFGAIKPINKSLTLGNFDQLKSEFFLERREMGILNLGGDGKIEADGEIFEMPKFACLYISKGTKEVIFSSNSSDNPALFYANSCPAHAAHPTTLALQSDANRVDLGESKTANERTIFQYIHENGIKSCQLVMGYTELAEGSIWNTFPPHTHDRRMEIYFYFDLPEDQLVLHLMGQPQETRHLFMKNLQAVISPEWSIHSGAGTSAYKFVWGMGGENQSFNDMDAVSLNEIK